MLSPCARLLPATNPVQMMPSKSRAATREAMSLFLRGSELRLAASLQSVKQLLWKGEDTCRYLYRCARESESVIHWSLTGNRHQAHTCPVFCVSCQKYVFELHPRGPVFIKAFSFHEKYSARLIYTPQRDSPFKSTSRFQQMLYVFLFTDALCASSLCLHPKYWHLATLQS